LARPWELLAALRVGLRIGEGTLSVTSGTSNLPCAAGCTSALRLRCGCIAMELCVGRLELRRENDRGEVTVEVEATVDRCSEEAVEHASSDAVLTTPLCLWANGGGGARIELSSALWLGLVSEYVAARHSAEPEANPPPTFSSDSLRCFVLVDVR
jgi:hypothetical protein